MLRSRRGERWAHPRRAPARVGRWVGRAVGVLAAWGLAGAWAQAAPPPAPAAESRAPAGTPSAAPPRRSVAPPSRSVAPPRSSATPPPPSTSPKLEEENARSAREEEVLPPQDLSGAWGYTRRGAPRPRYVRNTQDPIIFSANPIGFYSGVSVQGNQLPPHPVQVPGKSAVLTWAGFERTATGSRVFFQLSAEAEYAVTENDGLITIKMKKTRVNVRNNLRRLDLSYFKTPVQTVKVRRRGRSAVATLRLKRSSTPEVSYVDSQNGSGYKLLVVSFTHGAEPVRTSPAD